MSSTNLTVGASESADIILFPLCDRRGLISELLQSDDAQPQTEPESLFFAWLLDLPVSLDPAAAARAIFTASYRARVDMGKRHSATSRKGPSEELAMVRRKLYQLLHETCSPSFRSGRDRISRESARVQPASALQGD
ncbi:MAG: hypothetical protein KTR33_02960 [Gammaproteobacteria bacterium]|nr:hypothetical protein [Gammaproteobacteria bacterium]